MLPTPHHPPDSSPPHHHCTLFYTLLHPHTPQASDALADLSSQFLTSSATCAAAGPTSPALKWSQVSGLWIILGATAGAALAACLLKVGVVCVRYARDAAATDRAKEEGGFAPLGSGGACGGGGAPFPSQKGMGVGWDDKGAALQVVVAGRDGDGGDDERLEVAVSDRSLLAPRGAPGVFTLVAQQQEGSAHAAGTHGSEGRDSHAPPLPGPHGAAGHPLMNTEGAGANGEPGDSADYPSPNHGYGDAGDGPEGVVVQLRPAPTGSMSLALAHLQERAQSAPLPPEGSTTLPSPTQPPFHGSAGSGSSLAQQAAAAAAAHHGHLSMRTAGALGTFVSRMRKGAVLAAKEVVVVEGSKSSTKRHGAPHHISAAAGSGSSPTAGGGVGGEGDGSSGSSSREHLPPGATASKRVSFRPDHGTFTLRRMFSGHKG